MSDDRGLVPGDVATSPIVGAVLTLTITVGAVAAVMTWGIPQLQASQVQGTIDAVVEEMHLLDDLTEAIARSGGGVSGEVALTYDRGSVILTDRAPIWVVSYGVDGRADVTIEGAADGNATYRIVNRGDRDLASVHVSHARIGDNRSTLLAVEKVGDLASGTSAEVTVRDGHDDPVPLTRSTVRVRVHEYGIAPETRVAEAWIVDPGAVVYTLSASDGHHEIALTNGGVVVDAPTGAHVVDPDAVRHVDSATPRVFVSFERLTPDGTISAGPGSWKLKAVAGATRSLRPTGVNATDLSIEVPERADPWGQAIWNDHARQEGDDLTSAWTRTGDGVRLEGPVDLHLFYRRIVFPSGLQPS